MIVVHNHPNKSSLSSEDIRFAFKNKPYEIRATAGDGYYYIKVPSKIDYKTRSNFLNLEWIKEQRRSLCEEVREEVAKAVKDGILYEKMQERLLHIL